MVKQHKSSCVSYKSCVDVDAFGWLWLQGVDKRGLCAANRARAHEDAVVDTQVSPGRH